MSKVTKSSRFTAEGHQQCRRGFRFNHPERLWGIAQVLAIRIVVMEVDMIYNIIKLFWDFFIPCPSPEHHPLQHHLLPWNQVGHQGPLHRGITLRHQRLCGVSSVAWGGPTQAVRCGAYRRIPGTGLLDDAEKNLVITGLLLDDN